MSHATTPLSFELPSRTLDSGRVWRATSDVFGAATQNFILCGLLPFPAALAALVPVALTQGHDNVSFFATSLFAVVTIVLLGIAQNAVVYGAARVLSGESFAIRDALAAGTNRLPSLIAAWALSGLIVSLGLALLVVPGLIALVAFSLVGGACVFEPLGPIAALLRSVELTRGHLWRIGGAFALVVGVPFAAVMGVGGTLVGVFYAMHTEFSLVVTAALAAILLILTVMIFPAICMVLVAVLFVELRRIREGTAPERLEI